MGSWASLPDMLPAATGGDGMPEAEVGDQIYFCFKVENNSPASATYVGDIVIEDAGPGVCREHCSLCSRPLCRSCPARTPHRTASLVRPTGCTAANRWTSVMTPVSLNPTIHGDPINTVTLQGTSSGGGGLQRG